MNSENIFRRSCHETIVSDSDAHVSIAAIVVDRRSPVPPSSSCLQGPSLLTVMSSSAIIAEYCEVNVLLIPTTWCRGLISLLGTTFQYPGGLGR
jgi:hypothetical protein